MSADPRTAPVLDAAELAEAGERMHRRVVELFPIPRSLTGNGVRETLRRLAGEIPLTIHEVPTGTAAFDWTVPREWNLREGWIRGPRGEEILHTRQTNLHVLGYSVPVDRRIGLDELQAHLHSLPDQPDLVPYRTSYYREDWGFCLADRARQRLAPGEYHVRIDATLEPGHLTYGEVALAGEGSEEILLSCHVCHPSLANDNLSGVSVATEIVRRLADARRRKGLRVLFIPGTIGSLVWLSRNEAVLPRIAGGLVMANLGDRGGFHFKRSRQGDAAVDRAVPLAIGELGEVVAIEDFVPFGYDERQYCSPGFDLPVGSLTRTPWGRYPQYHTSADDIELVRPSQLAGSLAAYLAVLRALDGNARYRNLSPKGEPQLGRRGLYGAIGGGGAREREMALLWVLNFSDGEHDLIAIAERSQLPFPAVRAAADDLLAAGLLANA
jgi:aminopeptidase-like protein